MKVLITGAAGYVGQLLAKNLNNDVKIDRIFAFDKKQKPGWMQDNAKIHYLRLDLAKDDWEENFHEIPDVVIHLAFDIRTGQGKTEKQEFNNISGTERVLKYCINRKIKKIIYISSVAAYGAKPGNIGKLLAEEDPLTATVYPYASQKRKAEEMIRQYENLGTQIIIIRPGSINGPEGEKRKNLGLLKFIKNIAPILPITNNAWARQYIHEDDVIRAIKFFIFDKTEKRFDIFNLAPADFITMTDMSKLLHKKTIKIPPMLVKPSFALLNILKFPISPPPGSENYFIYPINVDGSKINKIGFNYKHTTIEAFLGKDDN